MRAWSAKLLPAADFTSTDVSADNVHYRSPLDLDTEGELRVVDDATVEAVGAEIGAVILNEFSSADVPREQLMIDMPEWQSIGPDAVQRQASRK